MYVTSLALERALSQCFSGGEGTLDYVERNHMGTVPTQKHTFDGTDLSGETMACIQGMCLHLHVLATVARTLVYSRMAICGAR